MEAWWMNFSFRPSISHSWFHSECGQIRWPCSVAPPFRTYFWATTWSFRMERNKGKCGKEFHASHSCTLPPKHLDVLRKGPRLTVDWGVPTIIKDYDCSSWLNGKRPAKRRETKIWLIMVHSVNNFVRSELPALKSDMAAKEIGKRSKSNGNWEPLTLTSKSMTQFEPRTQICTKYDDDSLRLVRTVLHRRIMLFNPGIVFEFHSSWCEQTSDSLLYFIQQVMFHTSSSLHVRKEPNKKIEL